MYWPVTGSKIVIVGLHATLHDDKLEMWPEGVALRSSPQMRNVLGFEDARGGKA
jgi:hypothetical protein